MDLPEAPHKQPYGMRSNLGATFNQAVQAGSPRTLVRTPTPGSGRHTGILIPRYSRLRGSPYSRRRGSCRPILTGNGDATQASIRIGLSKLSSNHAAALQDQGIPRVGSPRDG